jgi:hypothetical protein
MTQNLKVGDRVVLSREGRDQRFQGNAKTRFGVVTRVTGYKGWTVFVLKDGLKHPIAYWHGFWRRARKEKP